ncbi:hypothetical protein MIND_01302200 [Mycena indigotica]|uniref:Uncharacterized protein n=1 Tax=Mycena indigotica TaxID=2126181 RepID=A0A8H6S3G5_9AGAR|nr:uncharacterized protein MIND_01302200 [Mycena indigotica]KAF7290620.1 hypothetical protein MIND_01302200 [Mycena indigotica]
MSNLYIDSTSGTKRKANLELLADYLNYSPVGHHFLRSTRATELGWSFFLFNFYDYPAITMTGGWNLDLHPGMTARTFYRWMDIIIARDYEHTFELRPIKIQLFDIASYGYDYEAGDPIPRDSDIILQSGVYGPFFPFNKKESDKPEPYKGFIGTECPGMLSFTQSFNTLDIHVNPETCASKENETMMTVHIKDEVRNRDKGKCFFTGRTDLPTKLIWIIPPRLALTLFEGDRLAAYEQSDYEVADNVITIDETLVEPFNCNAFSIDFQNNNHITIFGELPDDLHAKISTLTPVAIPAHTEKFWHENFEWTLQANFLGGDIGFEHSIPTRNNLRKRLVQEDGFKLPEWNIQGTLEHEVLEVYYLHKSMWQSKAPPNDK